MNYIKKLMTILAISICAISTCVRSLDEIFNQSERQALINELSQHPKSRQAFKPIVQAFNLDTAWIFVRLCHHFLDNFSPHKFDIQDIQDIDETQYFSYVESVMDSNNDYADLKALFINTVSHVLSSKQISSIEKDHEAQTFSARNALFFAPNFVNAQHINNLKCYWIDDILAQALSSIV